MRGDRIRGLEDWRSEGLDGRTWHLRHFKRQEHSRSTDKLGNQHHSVRSTSTRRQEQEKGASAPQRG